MSVFALSDLHLSLAGQNKSMEVFGGRWTNYIEKLENNWNKNINQDDFIIIPGDISWGEDINLCVEDFAFLNNNLNGKKIIAKGNHDYWWNTAAKMNKFLNSNNFDNIKILHNNAYLCENYIVCGTRGWLFGEGYENDENKKILLREVARLDISIAMGESLNINNNLETIVFLHYPPIFGNIICKELLEVLKRWQIKRCFYGHLHGNYDFNYKKIYDNIEFDLIAADYLNFMPIKL